MGLKFIHEWQRLVLLTMLGIALPLRMLKGQGYLAPTETAIQFFLLAS